MAGTSKLSTLFKLWIPNDLFEALGARAKQSGSSKAQLVVDAMRECWEIPEPIERAAKEDKAA